MANIALNKFADASNSVFPYQPAKAVDGVLTPLARWVGSSPLPPSGTPAPTWLRLDLGAYYWINRWVVKQMGAVGWSPNYNLTDYKLQGSLDNANWFDIDTVTANSANSTDRMVNPTKVRWARIYVTKGLRCNTNFASIVDLELYPADPTSAKLTSLALSAGTLAPPFSSTTYSYTANVGYDSSSITVTPTVEDSRATIKVNGTPVTSGHASGSITINEGSGNTITVEVTPYIGDPQNYTITVTRASSPYLSGLVLKMGMSTIIPIAPPFNKTTLTYSANVAAGTLSVRVTPTAEDAAASITVNGTSVISGQSVTVNLTETSTLITINVTPVTGVDPKAYTVNVTKS